MEMEKKAEFHQVYSTQNDIVSNLVPGVGEEEIHFF